MKPSPAQIEVLRLTAEGLLLKQIAARRRVCYGTVKRQMQEVFWRLGARTKAHAVAIAIREGLL